MVVNTKDELLKDRLEAKRLYVNEGLTGNQVAEKVGVSANTISKWVRVNDWKKEREDVINRLLGSVKKDFDGMLLDEFLEYIELNHRDLYFTVKPLIIEFKNTKKSKS